MDNGTALIVSSLGMLIIAVYQLYAYTTESHSTERLWLAGVALLVMLGAIYSGMKMRAKQNPR
ncbi:hypothetical protein SAMN04488691_10426 [Haloferax larsenii]|uniref:Uncharacterized protein n=1 Tax=Haloferax larsenii TaxID=302484 RepID=A0A1H7P9Z5_HALLR|nr:hypothetical protein SAMN04488691_10426 [Haloferax larsenii]